MTSVQSDDERKQKAREANRRWRERNKESVAEYGRQWRAANADKVQARYERNRERILEQSRLRYLEDPSKKRASATRYANSPAGKLNKRKRLLAQYDLTPDQYDAMVEAQGGVCAACGGPPSQLGLVVDHCHATGLVRGLLCGKCNSALGLLDDDPQKVEALLAFIKGATHA